jgi:hypothetical protein
MVSIIAAVRSDDKQPVLGARAEAVRRKIKTPEARGVSKQELMIRARANGLIP